MANISPSWCEVCHLWGNVHYSNIFKKKNYMGNKSPRDSF